MFLTNNWTTMQVFFGFALESTNICWATFCTKVYVINRGKITEESGNREPSSAKTEAWGKNVVQETISSDRCYHNPKILTNHLICSETVAPLLIIFEHSFINRFHSDSLVHLASNILRYEFAEESYFLFVVEMSSSLLETPRPQFGLSTSLSLRPPIVDSAVPWACLCRRCSLSCFSS